MWTPRTAEEVQKWHLASEREARFQGFLIAGLSWLGIVVLLSGGWVFSGRAGLMVQGAFGSAGFWGRLPIFAIAGIPVAYWFYRRERARELESALNMTICPKCETAAESNQGEPCLCGGGFVLQSTVRWED